MIKKIFYINLDRNPDRNEHTINQLNRINYNGPIERIVAIDGRKLDIEKLDSSLLTNDGKYDALKSKGMYYILTPGSVGCALSHYNTFNKIIEEFNDEDHALIIEDDVTFDENFFYKLNNYIEKVPKFDILYLGYSLLKDPIEENNIYGKPSKIWGLFGYIINKKAAIELKKAFPLRYQIDSEIPKVFKNLNVFYLKDKLITSDDSQNTNSKFPTNTQVREDINIREGFGKKEDDNIIIIILIILFFSISFWSNIRF
jgi:GR25 family glycosyltransferase involved in LPS biosynthesis